MKQVYWTFILNTSKEDTAKKILRKALALLDNTNVTSCEPYWKDEALYRAELTQKLASTTPAEIIFELLQNASLLSYGYHLNLPSGMGLDNHNMSGVCAERIKVVGVSWISFDLVDE